MSQLLDREVVKHAALVVDANPTSRSVLMQHLRDMGFGTVKLASRVIDARDMLEQRRFEVVISDYYFGNSDVNGQDLLEELRREQMLPYSTVFVMVTGEATYAKVSEAAESALDSYLVKPYSAAVLFDRLKEARKRKRVLNDIFEAIEANDLDKAARLCLDRFASRAPYWLYAARIGAELLLSLKRTSEAKTLYAAVVAANPTPWARLGLARVQLAEDDIGLARRTLEKLIGELPQFADAYDVLGKVQVEQGQLEDALGTYRSAAAMTPSCILRLQHAGALSFYAGEAKTAVEMLERTWMLGSKSRLFDVLSMMLLAFMRFDAHDGKGLAQAEDSIRRFAETYPQSVRLRRMANFAQALIALHGGKTGVGLKFAHEIVSNSIRQDFDMEAATNTLSMWSRLARFGVDDDEYADAVGKIARRFSVSKAATEVLVAAVQHQANATAWIREAHAGVNLVAEQAMNHVVRGEPRLAVEMLLDTGGQTGNAKLIEMAGLVARRHQERIVGIDELTTTVAELSQRYCVPSTHIAGVRRSNRSAGGLVLRR